MFPSTTLPSSLSELFFFSLFTTTHLTFNSHSKGKLIFILEQATKTQMGVE